MLADVDDSKDKAACAGTPILLEGEVLAVQDHGKHPHHAEALLADRVLKAHEVHPGPQAHLVTHVAEAMDLHERRLLIASKIARMQAYITTQDRLATTLGIEVAKFPLGLLEERLQREVCIALRAEQLAESSHVGVRCPLELVEDVLGHAAWEICPLNSLS